MSISDRACLVSLEIKSPGFRKTSKRGSAELASRNDAENERIAASVALLPKHVLAPIAKLASAARKLVDGTSSPWQAKARLMPIPKIGELRTQFDAIKAQHVSACEGMLADYEHNAARYLAACGTFAADFQLPSREKIASQLSITLTFLPLPGGESDWRLKLQEEEIAILQAGIAASNAETVRANRERAREALDDMCSRVSAYKVVQDDSAKSGERIEGAFHQSALDNLRDTAAMLRTLNFLDDAGFADICDEMESIGKLKAQEIKASQSMRERILNQAEALRDNLN